MTQSDKLPTIGQAAELYGLTKEAFQKRIQRAIKSDDLREIRHGLRIASDTKTGLRDPFTPELSALLSASGFDVPAGIGSSERPESPIKPKKTFASGGIATGFSGAVKEGGEFVSPLPSYPNPSKPPTNPDKISDVFLLATEKPDTTKPDTPEIRQPEPDKKPDTSISDRFFQSEIIVLSALLILIFSDGFSMSLLAGRTFGGSGLAYVLFSVVGLIIGYSAISTTRAAYYARTNRWQTDWASVWIFVFAVFQTALHGSAFDLFGDWSDLVGRVLIVLSIPLATASLTTTILRR